MILQKKPVRSKIWMAGRDSSLQIKWKIILKTGRLQVAFWKEYIVPTKLWWLKYRSYKKIKADKYS